MDEGVTDANQNRGGGGRALLVAIGLVLVPLGVLVAGIEWWRCLGPQWLNVAIGSALVVLPLVALGVCWARTPRGRRGKVTTWTVVVVGVGLVAFWIVLPAWGRARSGTRGLGEPTLLRSIRDWKRDATEQGTTPPTLYDSVIMMKEGDSTFTEFNSCTCTEDARFGSVSLRDLHRGKVDRAAFERAAIESSKLTPGWENAGAWVISCDPATLNAFDERLIVGVWLPSGRRALIAPAVLTAKGAVEAIWGAEGLAKVEASVARARELGLPPLPDEVVRALQGWVER